MNRRSARLLVAGTLFVLPACFHTQVSTGAPPGPALVVKDWESGWLWGLIGPKEVYGSRLCPHGVSFVDTERTFLNQVASFFTLGIYAPMSIRIRCAARPGAPALPRL